MVTGQVAEVLSPKLLVMSPEILSHYAQQKIT